MSANTNTTLDFLRKLHEVISATLDKYGYAPIYDQYYDPYNFIFNFSIYFGEFSVKVKDKSVFGLKCYDGHYSENTIKCLEELSDVIIKHS